MIKTILLFILGLILLIKGGDWFVDGAVGIAKKFHIPVLIIGATIVSIGTTLPEVMVSSASAAAGHGQLAFGNAIGSIICNTALIAAITIAIKPAKVDKKSLYIPSAFFFVSFILYLGVAYTTGEFKTPFGILLLGICLVYIIVNVEPVLRHHDKGKAMELAKASGIEGSVNVSEATAMNAGSDIAMNADSVAAGDISVDNSVNVSATDEENDEEKDEEEEKEKPVWLNIVLLIIGATLIAIGADLLVDNGIIIAEALGVPETVIALTFIALGTSLPELVTAITSLVKGQGALSVGNICGANLFNLVLVSGMSITIGPFNFKDAGFATTVINGKEIVKSLIVDAPLAFIVMLILIVPVLIKGELKRWQGVLLLFIYVAFCIYQFVG